MDEDKAVLIVDDSPSVRQSLQKTLARQGYATFVAETGHEALGVVRANPVDVMVADLKMPGMDGIELLEAAKTISPALEVVIITGFGTIELAVEAMKRGAYDFIVKPFNRATLNRAVEGALAKRRAIVRQVELGAGRPQEAEDLPDIVGASREIRDTIKMIRQVAPSTVTVLIEGESGTGKEIVAEAIHRCSPRRDGPMIKVSCAALPETLLESELFGYEKGAFTGAGTQRKGRFELADGGTLFLDEIGSVSPVVQVKLLRVLQDQSFERLGGTKTLRVDVRLIAAAGTDLPKAVERGKFREDLYYRLNVITIRLSPLRERKSDVPLLVDHFIRLYGAKHGRQITGITRGALDLLKAHLWPGNIRELENTIERAVVLTEGDVLTTDVLPESITGSEKRPKEDIIISIGTTLEEIERRVIEETLRYTNGNKSLAASLLGIATRTIYRKLR